MYDVNADPARRSRIIALVGWLVIGTIAWGTIEVASGIFLFVRRESLPRLFRFDLEEHVRSLSGDHLDAYADAIERRDIHAPDPVLGWIRVAGSRYEFPDGSVMTTDDNGARATPGMTGPVLAAAYGDSFTEGLEVDDGDTWPAALGRRAGGRILNYGVSGYGPDQAVLALERHLSEGIVQPPLVILAMIMENLSRLLNSYRPFYTHPFPDKFLGFKPILIEGSSGMTPHCYLPSDTRDRTALLRAMEEASRVDAFWELRTEEFAFPFAPRAAGFLVRHGLDIEMPPPSDPDLTVRRMTWVLERFVGLAEQYGFVPVLALLPERNSEFAERLGDDHGFVDRIVEDSRFSGLLYVDVTRELNRTDREPIVPGFAADHYIRHSHPSPYGHEAIAAALWTAIENTVGWHSLGVMAAREEAQ